MSTSENSSTDEDNVESPVFKAIAVGNDSSFSSNGEEKMPILGNGLAMLLNRIRKNPYSYSYDEYLRFANFALISQDLNILRETFAIFSKIHAIAPETWSCYLRYEMTIAYSETEIKFVEKLFRRALKDFYSETLYFVYAHFGKRSMDALTVWEEILGTMGFDPRHTKTIFQLYRTFIHTTNASEISKEHLIIKSYRDQLKIPHDFLDDNYIIFCTTYKVHQLASKIDWAEIQEAYASASQCYSNIVDEYENSLYYSDESFEAYEKYITECSGQIDIHLLYMICERFVTKHCADYRAWEIYLDFIEQRLITENEVTMDLPIYKQSYIDINNRALRCCPNVYCLYVKRIYYIEKYGATDGEQFKDILERALSYSMNYRDFSSLWMEYLTALRRKTNFELENECDILRNNFHLAIQSLQMHFSEEANVQEFLIMWSKLEYELLKNPKAGKNLYMGVLENPTASLEPALWLEFITLESKVDIASARGLYKKAFDWQDYNEAILISNSWQIFERCFGTRKTVASCHEYITEHMALKCLQLLEKEKNTIGKKRLPTETSVLSPSKRKKDDKIVVEEIVVDEITVDEVVVDKIVVDNNATSKVKFFENENNDDRFRVFVKNLDIDVIEAELFEFFENLDVVLVEIARTPDGESLGHAEVQFKTKVDAEDALTMDGALLKNRPVQIRQIRREKDQSLIFKYAEPSDENRTIFIKNLANDASKSEIFEVFSLYGIVKDVRFVYFKNGKFKNIAYVEYENEKDAKTTVSLTNGMEYKGLVVDVAMAKPPPQRQSNSDNPESHNTNSLNIQTPKYSRTSPKKKASTSMPTEHQKPRLSLIPISVRKKIEESSKTREAEETEASKSNEDFRELVLKYAGFK